MQKTLDIHARAKYSGGAEMRRLKGDLTGAKKQLDATAVANRRFSQSLGGSTWRRQVQQAGMQVSDFAVQVAGGQSAILAFTQNAPQFIQNFGAMGGIIAAAISIIGAFVYTASRAAGAVLTFDKQIERTNETLSEYFSLIRSSSGAEAELFKRAEENLKVTSQTAQDLLMIERLKAFESVKNLSSSLADSVISASWLKTYLEDVGNIIGATKGEIISANLGGSLGEGVRDFYNALIALDEASTIDDMYDKAMLLRDMFMENVDVTGDMTAAQRTFFGSLAETIQKLELMGAAAKATADAVGAITGDQLAEGLEYFDSWVAAQQESLAVSNEIHDALGYVSDEARELAEELGQGAVEALKLANVDISGGIEAGVKSAARLAATLGIAYESALAIQRLNAVNQFNKRYSGRGSYGMPGEEGDAFTSGRMTVADKDSEMGKRISEILNGPSGRKSGGGGGAVSKAKTELDRFMESLKDVHPALKDMLGNVTDATLDAAKQIKTQFEETQEAISSSLMGSFKGLLNGTMSVADAIKGVLGDIADRIIDILMTPIFDGIAGNIAGWIGNSIFGGKGLGSFDGGGYTGNGARAGGLDGKGGRLAMLHPRETVFDHTKGQGMGGGGGMVTVRIEAPEGFTATQESQVQGIAVQVVNAGMTQFTRKALPSQVRKNTRDGRVTQR